MREYTTERDVTIGVVPIPLFLEELRKAYPPPARPTYTEHLAGNATQQVEISDREAAAWAEHDPETWAEHADKWTAYVEERDANEGRINDAIWKAVMLRSLVVELPEDNTWIQDQEELGISVPRGRKERRIHYIKTEVIGGMRDVLRLTAIAQGGDLSEEALSLAEASFRHSLARSILDGLTGKGRTVDAGDAGRADKDSKGLGAET